MPVKIARTIRTEQGREGRINEGPREVCYYCDNPAVAGCDWVTGYNSEEGLTVCDRSLCEYHIHRPFYTLDLSFCPDHCIICGRGKA